MKKFTYSVAAAIASLVPVAAFAQYTVQTSFIDSVMELIRKILQFAFPTLTAIAFLMFMVSLILFIKATPDEKTKARKGLVLSITALFILVSITGIIRLVQGITGTGGYNTIDKSQVPTVDLAS